MTGRTLRDASGEANGFDTIRLLAALAVIFSHAFPLTGAVEPLERLTGGQATIGQLAVAAFFVISGYLIPASRDRGTLRRFAIKRARRIMPGLVVAVLLCAFVIGPLCTSLPLADYLADPQSWRFLGHALFVPGLDYGLPGVFTGQPDGAVNGSLWSLKFEIACYGFVAAVAACARWRVALVVLAWLASFALARAIPRDAGGVAFYIVTMAGLFRFFGAGMLLYLFASRVPLRAAWGWAGLGLTAAAAFTPLFMEVAASAGAYALVCFAHQAGPRFRAITARGDLSYGVYVYAFPLQQLLVPLSLGLAWPWLTNALLALPCALLAGWLSWRWVERPWLQAGRNTKHA